MASRQIRSNDAGRNWARWGRPATAHGRRAQAIAAGLLAAISLSLGSAIIRLRPDQSYTAGFVLGEEGNQLYRADRVLHGLLPYRDFASQYGFLPTYLSSAFAWSFGNTMATNRLFHLVLSTITIVLLFTLLRRTLDTIGAFVASLIFLPVMLAVGLQTGNSTNVEYLCVERICLLTVMLIWRPPTPRRTDCSTGRTTERTTARATGRTDVRTAGRTWQHAVAMGLTLGIWQEVKFGGAFFAGAAVIVADLIWLACKTDRSRDDFVSWIKSSTLTLSSFVLVESVWLAVLFAIAPRDIAANAAWPAYVTGSYLKFRGEHRFPHLSNLPFFIQSQWIFFSCAILSIRGVIAWIRTSRQVDADSADLTLFIGTLFFLIASPFYFAHEWLWYQYCWALVPGACWCLARMPTAARFVLIASWTPTWFFLLHTAASGIDPTLVRYKLPDSQVIYVTQEDRETIDLFAAEAAKAKTHDQFIIALMQWSGGGFHFFFDHNFALRNYMIDEYSFRPRDQTELLSKLNRVGAIIGYHNGRDLKTRFAQVFGPILSQQLFSTFTAVSPNTTHLVMERPSSLPLPTLPSSTQN